MSALLKQHIKILEKYFKQKDVVELCINKPGEIWLETLDGWQVKNDSKLTFSALNNMAKVLATVRGQKFDEITPFLATSLPEYGYRIQVVGAGLAESGINIAIRIAQAQRFELESYMSSSDDEFKAYTPKTEKEAAKTAKETMSKVDLAELKTAIRMGKTILVVGGTSSGKTTLLNSIIRYIPEDNRVIVIEDTKELVVDQPNQCRWLKSKTGSDIAQISYEDIINAATRMRPDRILMGELDTKNTFPFLRILNTGHGGSLATVHANGISQSIDALVTNIQMSGNQARPEVIADYAKKAIDIVVYIERKNRRSFQANAEYIKVA
ncbi:P-type DNA transfer ATPase VirB11 [Desulfospira joergensenii]|uniref:P-type DNA transfer ATPase VirB11 n=1 Tax=Desulfospira joergensenii TaxID=53329 RepID=UPI00041B970E|nr:P-type DNA transfer ATPase VirB11 [Desulfospira joergensenii]